MARGKTRIYSAKERREINRDTDKFMKMMIKRFDEKHKSDAKMEESVIEYPLVKSEFNGEDSDDGYVLNSMRLTVSSTLDPEHKVNTILNKECQEILSKLANEKFWVEYDIDETLTHIQSHTEPVKNFVKKMLSDDSRFRNEVCDIRITVDGLCFHFLEHNMDEENIKYLNKSDPIKSDDYIGYSYIWVWFADNHGNRVAFDVSNLIEKLKVK